MYIPKGAQGIVGRGTLVVQKYSPEILTGAGLAAMTTGAILAIKATTHLSDVMYQVEDRIAQVKWDEDEQELEYTTAQLRKVYIRNALDFVKLYGPAASLFLSGAGAILAAHGIMQKRNVALVAAYNAVKESYAAYRKRVVEDLGEDKDRDYQFGITEVSEKGSDGKKSVSTDFDPSKMSRYARVFDEFNTRWQNEPEYNKFFLTAEQNLLNEKLKAVGHVFLNEVYERLGFEHTQEGSVVGWILSKDGDNYIDFGMYDAGDAAKRNFVNGFEKSIWLDFNVDGVIFDKI